MLKTNTHISEQSNSDLLWNNSDIGNTWISFVNSFYVVIGNGAPWFVDSDKSKLSHVTHINHITSCARGHHNIPPPLASWPFDLETGARITCDVGYLCANFSLPGPRCSRFRSDVHDRQTSNVVRRASSLNAPPRAGHNNIRDKRSSRLLYAKSDRKLTRFRPIRLHQWRAVVCGIS